MYQKFFATRAILGGSTGVTKLCIRRTIWRRRSICVSYDGGRYVSAKICNAGYIGGGTHEQRQGEGE